MKQITLFVIIVFFVSGCQQTKPEAEEDPAISLSEITSPAAVSGEPNLFASSAGDIYLSWIEKENDTTSALKFSMLENDKWAKPKTVAIGSDWFVNWADFPSLVAFDGSNQNLAAHWLQMRAEGTYDYDVRIALSDNRGDSWSESFIPHKDGVAAEHGFVSMIPVAPDRVMAVWLDGRFTKTGEASHNDHGHGHGGAMTLRTATFDPNGNLYDEAELDDKVCDCCQTAAALTSSGPIVVYRDRSDAEIRDIEVTPRIRTTV